MRGPPETDVVTSIYTFPMRRRKGTKDVERRPPTADPPAPTVSDEQGFFVFAAGLAGWSVLRQCADGLKCRAERGEERPPLAERRSNRGLHVVHRLLDAGGQIGEQLIG